MRPETIMTVKSAQGLEPPGWHPAYISLNEEICMKLTMEHKLNEQQKAEFKNELTDSLDELKNQMEQAFDNWEQTKKVFTYALGASYVVGLSLGFSLGYVVGRNRGN